MTRTTNGTLLASVPGRRSTDASRAANRSVRRGRTTLGALAFRALALALAWLAFLGRADRSTGRAIGLVCGPDLGTLASRVGVDVRPARDGARRDGAARTSRRAAPPRRFGASRFAFIHRPSPLPDVLRCHSPAAA